MPNPPNPIAHLIQGLIQAVQPRPAGFSKRLTSSVVVIVVLTVLFGALPAVFVIYLQLQNQFQSRVQETQLATQAIYEAERDQLLDLTLLIAERPTLCSKMLTDNRGPLVPYLDTIRQGTPIDTLLVITKGQEPILSGLPLLYRFENLLASSSAPFADFIAQEEPAKFMIVAAVAIDGESECTAHTPSWILAIQVMDDQDMRALAKQTGVDQSLIINGHRAASSLSGAPDWSLDIKAAEKVQKSLTSCCSQAVFNKDKYYIGLAPIIDQRDRLVAISELALPANVLQQAALNSLGLLFGTSFVIVLTCALVLLTLTNRITLPLRSLVEATRRLSEGDLEQPIPTRSDWIEINELAEQLEVYRRHLQRLYLDEQREKRLLLRMLSASRDGVVRISPDGLITYINPDGESILGLQANKVLLQHYDRIFRPAPGAPHTLSDIFQPPYGKPPAKRLTILDAKDCPLDLTVTATWIEPAGVPDILQARMLVFRRADEDLASNRLHSEILANLAHEFRTPLSSITASIEMLSEEGLSMSKDEVTELANTALLGSHHLQTLIDNVLESALIEADSFRLRCHPILLRDVLQNAVHIMSPLLKRRQQFLDIDQPKHYLTIFADPDRLCQAIVNLLDNASKYSPFGSTINLSFTRQGQWLVFSVMDSGPGISIDRQDDLFKRFTSLTDLQGAHYGIGLGLPVVKTIIEAHGGRVGAENRPEGGARFWCTLPIRPGPNMRDQND